MKKLFSAIALAIILVASASAEVEATFGLSFPLQTGNIKLKNSDYNLEVKGEPLIFSGFGLELSAYMGSESFPVLLYADLGFTFELDKYDTTLSVGINSTKGATKQSSFSGDAMIGPGFKLKINETLHLNVAPGFHVHWSTSKTENDTTSYTDTEVWLGGGLDAQLRYGRQDNPLSFVLGMKFLFDGLTSCSIETLDALVKIAGINDYKTEGFMFTWLPYLGLGVKF